MRVLVTGSRDWPRPWQVGAQLNRLATSAAAQGSELFTVVHGACPTGADAHASAWVRSEGPSWQLQAGLWVHEERHPADWKGMGRRAGPHRNAAMVALGADVCVAFIGPCTSPRCARVTLSHPSHGATGCAQLAEAAGIEVRRYTA